MREENKKDAWDKADVLIKALVPIVVGFLLFLWNQQRTEQQETAALLNIAVEVLKEEPRPPATNELRFWAIEALRNPSDPPPLSDEAALMMRTLSTSPEIDKESADWLKQWFAEQIERTRTMTDAELEVYLEEYSQGIEIMRQYAEPSQD